MNSVPRRVLIRETPHGWEAGGELHETAADALESVFAACRETGGAGTVITVDWLVSSLVGRLMAEVLAR